MYYLSITFVYDEIGIVNHTASFIDICLPVHLIVPYNLTYNLRVEVKVNLYILFSLNPLRRLLKTKL